MEKEIKIRKLTREELAIELAKIRSSHGDWVSGDENRRIEFAKAFNWFKKRGQYDYQVEYRTPTWIEIFIEIGKLLASRNFMDFEGNLSELKCKLEDLENKLTPTNEKD